MHDERIARLQEVSRHRATHESQSDETDRLRHDAEYIRTMFIVLVKVQVKPELLGEFKTAILKNAELSVQRDPGCVRFDVLQQEDDATRWFFYEVYEEEHAWVQHRSSPHFLAFKDVGDRAILSRDVTKLTGINVNG